MAARSRTITKLRVLPTAALLGILAVTSAGCAGPAPSYSALDDEDMKKLFPTESEIAGALGQTEIVIAPKSQTLNPSASPQPNEGWSQECYEAAYGTPESRATVPTRMFVTQSAGSNGNTKFTWVLAQRSSADDVKKSQENLKTRLMKCNTYEIFDSGSTSGTSYATKPTSNGPGPSQGATGIVTSGDVSLAFSVSGVSYQDAEGLVKKMVPIMEKRLQASAPKS